MTTTMPLCLIGSSSVLQATKTAIRLRISSNFGMIRTGTAKFAALKRLEKYGGEIVVITLQAFSFFIESSSYLEVTRACMTMTEKNLHRLTIRETFSPL